MTWRIDLGPNTKVAPLHQLSLLKFLGVFEYTQVLSGCRPERLRVTNAHNLKPFGHDICKAPQRHKTLPTAENAASSSKTVAAFFTDHLDCGGVAANSKNCVENIAHMSREIAESYKDVAALLNER